NLAQAVLLVCYELMLGRQAGHSFAHDPRVDDPLASQEQMERLFAHFCEVLYEIDFMKPGHERHMMGSLRGIFQRAALDRREVSILRGILSEVTASRQRMAPRDGEEPPQGSGT
ncbi:MAG: hypothetical protein H7831_15725, partial [Magnetococcus sp. WYHC-3]